MKILKKDDDLDERLGDPLETVLDGPTARMYLAEVLPGITEAEIRAEIDALYEDAS